MQVFVDMFAPFKDATFALESSLTPTAHKAGRILLRLLYRAHASMEGAQVSRKALRRGVINAMRSKLGSFIDDKYLLLEWAVAAFLDPRAKALLVRTFN